MPPASVVAVHPGSWPTRRIRVFVSSPGDVADERAQCGAAVQELNATLRALLPDRGVELELIRWETHTFPDIAGEPQQVVDDQIAVDYDIFIGIMWTRFGTPTSTAGSGTEHEFRAAYTGWQERRIPAHILFYFGEAAIPAQLARENAEQLKAVNDFHVELARMGLVDSYEVTAKFGDKVRRHLVLVLSKLLNAGEPVAQVAEQLTRQTLDTDLAIVRQQVRAAAEEYRSLRVTMPKGAARTRRMEVVASNLRTLAQSTFGLLPELTKSDDPGSRLAAVSALQVIPDVRYLDWLAERMSTEKPFVGYHAAVALLAAARELPLDQLDRLDAALTRAENEAARLPADADRTLTLRSAREELRRRTA